MIINPSLSFVKMGRGIFTLWSDVIGGKSMEKKYPILKNINVFLHEERPAGMVLLIHARR